LEFFLDDLKSLISLPWTLIGGINEIFLPSEQRGGNFSSTRAARFGEVIGKCGLMDVEFFGSKFAWQRNCNGGG